VPVARAETARFAAIQATPVPISTASAGAFKIASANPTTASTASSEVLRAVFPSVQMAWAIKATTTGFTPNSSPANWGAAPNRT